MSAAPPLDLQPFSEVDETNGPIRNRWKLSQRSYTQLIRLIYKDGRFGRIDDRSSHCIEEFRFFLGEVIVYNPINSTLAIDMTSKAPFYATQNHAAPSMMKCWCKRFLRVAGAWKRDGL
jgi:hypothetical protein